jgi:hypothetical protein
MHLYDPVTFGESTPRNGDYVDCSAFPGNGICAKIEGDPARGPLRDAQRSKEIPQVDSDLWKRL